MINYLIPYFKGTNVVGASIFLNTNNPGLVDVDVVLEANGAREVGDVEKLEVEPKQKLTRKKKVND